MVHKKKYHGGLFLFFATLCVLLFINTCSFANTNVTREYIEWIWDYQLNNTNYVTTANTNCNSNKTFITNNFNKDTCITDIYNKLSQYQQNNNITQFGNVNLSVFPRFNDYTMAWFFVLSNSGAPSGLDDISGFLYVKSPDRFGTLEDNVYIMKVYFNGLTGSSKTLSYQYETRTSVIDESSLSNIFINNSLDVVTIRNCCFAGIPAGYYYYNNNYIPVNFQSLGGNFVPSQNNGGGDNNSGEVVGDITNSSGENTGNINLQPIVDGLGNIQNQISGDTTRIIENQNNNTNTIVNTISGEFNNLNNTLTEPADDTIENTNITSGDIYNSLGFEVAQDPYANFWLTLTNNLKTALLGSVRSIDITFRGQTYTISLDNYLTLPGWLILILAPITTCLTCWVLVRQWKIIINKLTSGNIDSLLKENSQEGISNLF